VPKAGCVLLKGARRWPLSAHAKYQYYLDGTWQYSSCRRATWRGIQRQQDFIKLAIKKAEQVAPINPVALNDVIAGVAGSLTVDDISPAPSSSTSASVLRHANAAGIPEWTYPTVNSTEVPAPLTPLPSETSKWSSSS